MTSEGWAQFSDAESGSESPAPRGESSLTSKFVDIDSFEWEEDSPVPFVKEDGQGSDPPEEVDPRTQPGVKNFFEGVTPAVKLKQRTTTVTSTDDEDDWENDFSESDPEAVDSDEEAGESSNGVFDYRRAATSQGEATTAASRICVPSEKDDTTVSLVDALPSAPIDPFNTSNSSTNKVQPLASEVKDPFATTENSNWASFDDNSPSTQNEWTTF